MYVPERKIMVLSGHYLQVVTVTYSHSWCRPSTTVTLSLLTPGGRVTSLIVLLLTFLSFLSVLILSQLFALLCLRTLTTSVTPFEVSLISEDVVCQSLLLEYFL